MPASRQLAAIMFTDIVGYTALMGEDEQKAFELLRKNRQIQKPAIEKYNGRWIKELGDGILASFPTVSDAVTCAIEIQHACNNIDELKLRIGIHLGEVVFEDNDMFGDGVNIASRIQALAPVGGIWISESVYKNISNKKEIRAKFACEEVLKNVKEPMRIYEVITQQTSHEDVVAAESKKKLFQKSIAVLPFVDMSSSHDQEYLGDGLAEELINLLSQIKELKVIGRTSSFSFKATKTDLKTIGKTLNASAILEGSVQKAGNKIRITAQLINADDGYHIWSQRYDREIDDIFALQDDICSKIAEHLKLSILEGHATIEENRPTKNPKAYEWFLKADYYVKRYGWEENIDRVIDCCKKAIELDSEYADAWWLLGACYYQKHGWVYFQKENIETAIYCTNKAISIDETNADAHFMLALINLNYYYDWGKTMSEVALANQYTRTPYPLFFLPVEAWIRGSLYTDFDFAIRHMQKGIDHDPLNFIYQFHLAMIYLYLLRDYEKVRNILNNIIDLGFPAYASWQLFCLSYLFDGRYPEAEEYARKDYEASGGKGHGAANLIISLAATGKKKEAEELYQSVKQTLPIPEFPEFLHVRANAWLGRIDDAFEYLDKAITERSFWLFTLKVFPEWDPLRSDSRFQKVLERMKFPK